VAEESHPHGSEPWGSALGPHVGSVADDYFPGTTVGEQFQKPFAPVGGREFRRNILDATDGPTIAESEVV